VTGTQRLYSATLYGLMALGALAVWTAVPFGTLWALSHFAADGTELLVLALLGVPSAMIFFAMFLSRLNIAYVALHRPAPGTTTREEWQPRVRGPLEHLLTYTPIAAAIGFAAWFALRPGPPFHL
jgi:hypothetical protein